MHGIENISIDTLKNIIVILSSLTVYNTAKNYKLCKDFNDNKEIKIINHEEIKDKFTNTAQKRLLSLKFGKDILNFKKKLAQNLNSKDLNLLYNNLKTIKTKDKLFFLKHFLFLFVGGNYNPKNSKINIWHFVKNDVINHELLHMASSIYDDNNKIGFCGFCQFNYKTKSCIGRALNEGYTEVLHNRYFKNSNITSHSYKVCEFFASMLEIIIGKEKMQSAYFNANLNELIIELEKYDSLENIIKFIKSLDFFLKYEVIKHSIIFLPIFKTKLNNNLKESLKCCQECLIKWYTKKKKNDLSNPKDIESYIYSYSRLVKNNKTLSKYKI